MTQEPAPMKWGRPPVHLADRLPHAGSLSMYEGKLALLPHDNPLSLENKILAQLANRCEGLALT